MDWRNGHQDVLQGHHNSWNRWYGWGNDGHYYSPTTVSNITKRTEHLVEKFHERKFKHSQYVCAFLDPTYIPLRRGTVEWEAVNVAIGIRSDGGKEVLDYSIAPTENGAAWSELLQGLRARGIKDIQLFIANYPQAKFQRCWVHAERNLLGYVRKNDRREIITDFKAIRQAENLQAAKERLAAVLSGNPVISVESRI